MDEHLSGGDVGGHGDVVHIAQAQQGHLIGLAGLCIDGVAEEQQQVHLIAGNAGRDLLVTALNPCQETLHLQARGLCDHLASRPGGHQFMLAQNPAVRRTELNHQLLFGVMRNQCNRHRSTSPFTSPGSIFSLGHCIAYIILSQFPSFYNCFLGISAGFSGFSTKSA